jgi:hypothetical protein
MGESGVLSMTSGWPVAVFDDDEGVDELELLHATTPRARALATTTLFKIVCLIA